MKISSIHSRQILDSRGNPTMETDVTLENGTMGRAAVPSGASTGIFEAHELRDGDMKFYNGKSVLQAVSFVNTAIRNLLKGQDVFDQKKIDSLMINADGTKNKSKFGANAILSVSLACLHTAANEKKIPLYRYIQEISNTSEISLPVPLANIINGGKHAAGSTDIQEFMIVPFSANSFSQALQMATETFHALHNLLKKKGYGTTVGDEGGFAPHVKQGNSEALDLIMEAIENAGYEPGKQIGIALDVAASELFQDGTYHLATENRLLTSSEMIDWLSALLNKYPIISIEDGLAQDDWDGWIKFTKRHGEKMQIVGDDLLVTNVDFLKKGIEKKAANAILIKLNQIGTVTETIEAVQLAQQVGWHNIISHRSGETEDVSIAHFAVGLNAGQIKTGSLSRTDRVAKYNELLRIEEQLGKKAQFNNLNTKYLILDT